MNLIFSSSSTREYFYRVLCHLSKVNDFVVLYPTSSRLMIYSTSSCSCLFTVYTLYPEIFTCYSCTAASGYKIHVKALLNLLKREFKHCEFTLANDRLHVLIQSDVICNSFLLYEKVVPALATFTTIPVTCHVI